MNQTILLTVFKDQIKDQIDQKTTVYQDRIVQFHLRFRLEYLKDFRLEYYEDVQIQVQVLRKNGSVQL